VDANRSNAGVSDDDVTHYGSAFYFYEKYAE
jgi:hypothetical protein